MLALLGGLLAIALSVTWVVHQVANNPIWPEATDMGNYLDAARRVLDGQNPYASDFGHFHRLPYPPLFGDFIAALTALFGRHGAAYVWMTANGLAMIAAVTLIMRNFSLRVPYPWIVLFCGILAIGRSGRSDLYHGQVNFPLLLLLVLGFLLWRARRKVWASLAWAIMINVKPFLGVLVVFLMRQRDWRTTFLTLALSAAILAGSFLPMYRQSVETFVGWRQVTSYYASPAWATNPLNQSFYGFLLRLFTHNEFSQAWADSPALVAVGLALVSAVALTAVFLVSAPAPEVKDSGEHDLLRLATVLAAFMSIGPVTEGDHLYILLPGLIMAVTLAWRSVAAGAPRRRWWLAAAAAWFCVFMGPLSPKQFVTHFVDRADWALLHGPGILLSGFTAVALLAAAVLTACVFWLERRDAAAPPAISA